MTVSRRLIFLILAYNEEKNIGRLLQRIAAMNDDNRSVEILVVNDGSTDRTREVAIDAGGGKLVRVLDHPANLGVGQGFRTGFGAALTSAGVDDIIVTIEADNTSDLGVLGAMIAQIDDGSDVSLASCYAPGGGVLGTTRTRMLLSKAANLLVRALYQVSEVHTYSSFYRAYRASALRRAAECYGVHLIDESGFACMAELLVKLHRLGLRITEVPVVLDGGARQGTSKMRIGRTMSGYFRFMLRDCARNLLTRGAVAGRNWGNEL